MNILQDVAQKVMKAAVPHVPDRWLPGAASDPLRREQDLIGAPMSRVDGPLKVTGTARFAAEVPLDGLLYAALVYSTIQAGVSAH